MKKYIVFTACVLALLALSACGEVNKTIDSTSEETTSVTFSVEDDVSEESDKADNTSAENSDKSKSEASEDSKESSKKAASSKTTSSKKTTSKTTASKTTSSKTVSSEVSSREEVSSVVSSEPEVSSEETVSEDNTESSAPLKDIEVTGKWTATKITDSYGSRIDGEQIYGTAYRQYGGSIEFNGDGTFCLRMGVSLDDASTEGTYTYDGGEGLTMLSYDDTRTDCSFEELNGLVTFEMPISLFGDKFTVYFVKK
ncbi:MAG: hypothetical protein VZR27_06085 [Acutalibacteraceae bacterium]|nr:hypothetical protein [Acutalibacteraceae bacterium]